MCVYMYIYIYIYNLHLGLINAPPYVISPSKRYLSLLIYYQKGQTYIKCWPNLVHYPFTIKKARSGGLGLY